VQPAFAYSPTSRESAPPFRPDAVILYPAIDIRDGRAVRLIQGDYDRETAFDADPLDAATRWVEQGAKALHVVDLDGARAGAPVNIEHVARICDAVDVPVQAGGGLRQAGDVEAVLRAGAARAILGSAAVSDPALVEALVVDHGDRIVVSADARSGAVAVEGWERPTKTTSADLIAALAARGVRRFVFTPVEVDGTLEGPGVEGLRAAAAAAASASAELIYSGGIGTIEHLSELAALRLPALTGVIVGRALYEGHFTVAEGEAALGPR
jgi:phosphoribosylformimino-5-aminoimidazole carboxamide ribotide isomerase